MGFGRAILCIIFPPLAVFDKGCGAVLLTLILYCLIGNKIWNNNK